MHQNHLRVFPSKYAQQSPSASPHIWVFQAGGGGVGTKHTDFRNSPRVEDSDFYNLTWIKGGAISDSNMLNYPQSEVFNFWKPHFKK